MAFIDEITLKVKAGDGGSGVVRWLHLKGKEFSGPAGGNGGNGGDIYVRAVSDLNLLSKYRSAKRFAAENGAAGGSSGMDGKRGENLTIDIPRGSIVTNESTGEQYELLREGQSPLILKGGRGGAGNRVFKSSVNRSPKEAFPGTRGEEAQLRIELRLIADAGLIGLPNAGKTTLLNMLTGTSAKVASYPFTTLDPNLGLLYAFVLADIPGLIEGASEGKGLGSKFLRHISRTSLLIHCISLESSDPKADYEVVRNELAEWEAELLKKPECIVLTKSDTRDTKEIQHISAEFMSEGKKIEIVSALDDRSIELLRKKIVSILEGREGGVSNSI